MADEHDASRFRLPWKGPAQHVARRAPAASALEWRDTIHSRLLVCAAIFACWTVGIEARLVYLQVAQHGEIAFEDMFTGDSPSIGAAAYVAGPLAFLLTNDYEPVEIDRLDLTIVSSESPRTAELEGQPLPSHHAKVVRDGWARSSPGGLRSRRTRRPIRVRCPPGAPDA